MEYALIGDKGSDKGLTSSSGSSSSGSSSSGSSSGSSSSSSGGSVDGMYDVLSYHGDLNSKERESNLQSFKDGNVQYLVSFAVMPSTCPRSTRTLIITLILTRTHSHLVHR